MDRVSVPHAAPTELGVRVGYVYYKHDTPTGYNEHSHILFSRFYKKYESADY